MFPTFDALNILSKKNHLMIMKHILNEGKLITAKGLLRKA